MRWELEIRGHRDARRYAAAGIDEREAGRPETAPRRVPEGLAGPPPADPAP